MPNDTPGGRLTRKETLRHAKPSIAWRAWCSTLFGLIPRLGRRLQRPSSHGANPAFAALLEHRDLGIAGRGEK
jgi:hypothetical protein